MILSDGTIKQMLKDGSLTIDPIREEAIQPASVDCYLGNHFLIVDHNHMDSIRLDSQIKYREVECEHITIPANSFLLATTKEYFKLPSNIMAMVEGRSSVGRTGLFIQNAGLVDPGFEGNITLELYNANSLPIKLDAGRRICQIVFYKMDKDVLNPYNGKYQGQKKSTGSKIFDDFEIK